MNLQTDEVKPLHVMIRGVTASAPGDGLPLLDAVDLELRNGEFLSLVGPAGSGKSLLLRMIAGLARPASGEVLISGDRVRAVQVDLGVVFTDPSLLGWRSVLDNVMIQAELRGIGTRQTRERALWLLAFLGLSGLEGRRAHTLTVDLQTRVSVCRALLHNPALLLMEEPASSIDPVNRENLMSDLQRLWLSEPRSVLLATRDVIEAVVLSDRVAVMSPRPGRILEVQEIDLPRPRRLDKATTPRIAELGNRVRTLFHAHGVLR